MTTDERELCWDEFERATRERAHAFRQPVVMSVDERLSIRQSTDLASRGPCQGQAAVSCGPAAARSLRNG